MRVVLIQPLSAQAIPVAAQKCSAQKNRRLNAMLAKGDEVDVEVRLEDQLQINEFGRNNDRIS